jgi:hypothetical protein
MLALDIWTVSSHCLNSVQNIVQRTAANIRRPEQRSERGDPVLTTATDNGAGLRRVTGWLLVIGAVTFAVAATVPVAWTYAILLVPILLLPAALGRREDPVLGRPPSSVPPRCCWP